MFGFLVMKEKVLFGVFGMIVVFGVLSMWFRCSGL